MKKLLIILGAVTTLVFTGCHTVPTPDKMESTAQAIGFSAGLVANNINISDKDRNIIVDIIGKVSECTPADNQTFVEAWTPIATEYVNKMVADGKINQDQAVLILKVFDIIANGVDYVFDKVYPKARQYENLVTAAIRGFTKGFLTSFKPVNKVFDKSIKYDAKAYDHLIKLL